MRQALAIAAVLLLASYAAADTHYIAPAGTDTGDCTNSGSPCASPNYAIGQAAAGDTIEAAAGTYDITNLSGVTGCAPGTQQVVIDLSALDCVSSACTFQGASPSDRPVFSLSGSAETGLHAKSVDNWTVKDIVISSPEEGFVLNDTTDITIQNVDFIHTETRDSIAASKTIFNRLCDAINTTISDVSIRKHENWCDIDPFGWEGINAKYVDTFVLEDSYIGYMNSLMSFYNNGANVSTNITIRRNEFEHWSEHGIYIRRATDGVVIENNLFHGSTLTTGDDGIACDSNDGTWVTGQPNEHNWCLDPDALEDPLGPNEGGGGQPEWTSPALACTSDAQCVATGDYGPNVTCNNTGLLDGPRAVDMNEATDVLVRNNTFAGIVGIPVSAIWNDASACPGDALDPDADGDCDLDNIRFYNNIVYDLGNTTDSSIEAYVNLQDNGDTVWVTALNIDGNMYDDGSERWACRTDATYETVFATWQASTCFSLSSPDANSTHSTTPTFFDYANADFSPLNVSSPQVDAGINSPAEACASDDKDGNPRDDGSCDIGAYEFQQGAENPTGELKIISGVAFSGGVTIK